MVNVFLIKSTIKCRVNLYHYKKQIISSYEFLTSMLDRVCRKIVLVDTSNHNLLKAIKREKFPLKKTQTIDNVSSLNIKTRLNTIVP